MTYQISSTEQIPQYNLEGPLELYINQFASNLNVQGYATFTIQYYVRLLAHLSRWLDQQDFGINSLSREMIDKFILNRKTSNRIRTGDVITLHRFLDFLHDLGVIDFKEFEVKETAIERIVKAFSDYLVQERGLTDATLKNYLPTVRTFLSLRFGDGSVRFTDISSKDLTGFILEQSNRLCLGGVKLIVTTLRSFLRYLLLRGEIATDLAACVPTVAHWKLTTLPRSLEPMQVEQVLAHCNRQTKVGQRDFAILLLLARLGLRAGEIVALSLDDIDWKAGEITIRGKGATHYRLPLPWDVGEALVTYLHHGRPSCSMRRIFIRSRAPLVGFASSVAISNLVCRALKRAGLHPPHQGAHLFRHSLACSLLNSGASLSEIGELLRHQHPDTTAIYAKVDLPRLQGLVQPWPGGES